ncbi:hypothetical protein ACIGW8_06830 [Streptomyces sioyaensis]|uniref:hypothetical protein n=1 Tax=Streptomyces sioyaensis TaxID=67364 RepID=UPI0037CD45A4
MTAAATAALWNVRGRRRVRVLPGRAAGGGASIAVSVFAGEGRAPAASVPACALFCGARAVGCGALPADTDEHFALDAEACTDGRWLACADVLHGSRPWPAESAVGWVRDLLTRYTGCRLAGLPLIGGGWAVAERLDDCRLIRSAFIRSSPPRPERTRAAWEYSLMASCLHGLVATGYSLEELLPLTVLSLG